MPQINNIEITEDDINYAENILLREGKTFDDERKIFIQNLNTIDLQAVPGSGKTTALLAKLLILEKKMPFSDGSGILVLSHTNTAVDEIKDKLGKIAPKLFEFPNFIGTIQEFVNKFLAKPYGINYLGIKFQHIDTDYYESLCYIGSNGWLDRRGDKEDILKKSMKNGNDLFYVNGADFPLKDNTKDLYKKILKMKSEVLAKGIISYDEAYVYGKLYIKKYPNIIKILQNRFKYVFIDEMQDMQKHQVDILENLFYDDGSSISKIQRIGDSNQAIYDGIVSEDCMWKGRNEITGNSDDRLKIIGSHRFTEKISKVVKCFGLTNNDLNGKREIINGTDDISIKPILLVYNNLHLNNPNSEPIINDNKILGKFSDIIKEKIDEGYFRDVDEIISKAIIWSAKSDTDRNGNISFELNKCRAKHYFFDYDIFGSKSKNKTWFKSEKDYLVYYDKNDMTYKSKYNNLINLFIKILRVNDIKNDNNKYFNKTSLFKYLTENNYEKYLEFITHLLNWSKDLNNGNIDQIAEKIDLFFPEIISLLPGNKNINLRVKDSEYTEGVIINNDNDKKMNIYSKNGIEISIGTVHSVKGETHTCTLYLESSSNGYESFPKIKGKPYLGEDFDGQPSNGKQAMKMLYVGLSRPTHLLCYAIHEDRYNKLILGSGNEEKLKNLWEIKQM